MTDEKPIYISPEDDVTTVRERLEKTSNRQVTMVIPEQTQLRSLVAWRVLHADARRMGKDVLVVSTDPQIRSLAQAGKFRVANSQASSITNNKSRPPTRGGRTGGIGKGRLTSSQARMQAAKKPSVQLPPDVPDEEENAVQPPKNTGRKAGPFNQWYGSSPEKPAALRDTERPFEASTTGNLPRKNTSPSAFKPKQEPGQIYDLDANTSAPVPHVSPLTQDDATAYWSDGFDTDAFDYDKAKDIRNSTQDKEQNVAPPVVPLTPRTPQETPREPQGLQNPQDIQSPPNASYGSIYRTTPLPQHPTEGTEGDFYQAIDDHSPRSGLAEQRGAALINGLDTSEQSSHDGVRGARPEIRGGGSGDIQVEDMGDDPVVIPFEHSPISDGAVSISDDLPHHSWSEPLVEEQSESTGPSRIHKANAPRSSRRDNRENIMPPVPPMSRRSDLDDGAALPDIEDRNTIIMSPQEVAAARPRSGTRPIAKKPVVVDVPETPATDKKQTGKRASQQILGTNPRTAALARPSVNVSPRTAPNVSARRPTTGRAAPATRKLPKQTSSMRSSAVLALVAVLLILAVGIPAFVVPTADVTLKLPAKDYSHAVTLKAVATGQLGTDATTVPADQLANDFEATGTGKATSSAKVGIAPATGTVTFTNKGAALITIPSGTVITTINGTAFSTQAEAVVNVANSNVGASIQVPIKAQAAGINGNVPAGSINAIPPDSLNSIAMYNKLSGSGLNLTVINEQATASGGVGNTPAIAQQDIDATKAALRSTLNSQFTTWLAQKVMTGDHAGTVMTTETLVNAPTVGQTTADGTFTEKLRLSVSVLIVRAAALQRATITQLTQFVKLEKNLAGYALVDDAKLPVQVQQLKTTSDGKTTLTLAFTAAGKVVQGLDVQHVQTIINGKNIKDARGILLSLQGVQHVDISTGPHIAGWTPPWITFLSSHITIHLVPEDVVTPPKKK